MDRASRLAGNSPPLQQGTHTLGYKGKRKHTPSTTEDPDASMSKGGATRLEPARGVQARQLEPAAPQRSLKVEERPSVCKLGTHTLSRTTCKHSAQPATDQEWPRRAGRRARCVKRKRQTCIVQAFIVVLLLTFICTQCPWLMDGPHG